MTIRTVLNPYGGFPPIVDAQIGTAFATVHIVALNLETITYVANNLDAIGLVYLNYPTIEMVANNMAVINVVSQNIAPIDEVATNMSSVVAVATNTDDIALVALNNSSVTLVANNMAAVSAVAQQNAIELSALVTGLAGAVNVPVNIPFPSGVTNANLLMFAVCIVTGTNEMVLPGAKYSARINANALEVIVLTPGAALVGDEIRWFIRYDPTV